MQTSLLTIWDLLLTPVYLGVLVLIAKRHREKWYPPGHHLRQFYLPGLLMKFGGVILIGLIYAYVYKGGDTFLYLQQARNLNSALDDSVFTWWQLVIRTPYSENPKLYYYIEELLYWYNDPSSYTVVVIGAFLGLLNGNSYMPIGLLLAYLSYTGIWAMYRTFVVVYPKLYKQLAIAFLFIPSTIIWGSSLFKDTICMFGLGWLTYTVFNVFVKKDLSWKNLVLLFLSIYILYLVKLYILLSFLPALVLWLLMTYAVKIRYASLRFIMYGISIGLLMAGFVYLTSKFRKELDEYSLENIVRKAETTRGWITYVSQKEEGSGYNLGKIDGSFTGLISKFPAAVNVTLFRPYLWEVKKPMMLLSAIEAFAFLFFSLFILYKRGIGRTFKRIINSPTLTFFLVFSLIFAFSVGISTGNFGTLSRYKIPCMPFFAALLVVLYYEGKNAAQLTTRKKYAKPLHHIA